MDGEPSKRTPIIFEVPQLSSSCKLWGRQVSCAGTAANGRYTKQLVTFLGPAASGSG